MCVCVCVCVCKCWSRGMLCLFFKADAARNLKVFCILALESAYKHMWDIKLLIHSSC